MLLSAPSRPFVKVLPLLAALFLTVPVSASAAAPGDLDTSFGDGGTLALSFMPSWLLQDPRGGFYIGASGLHPGSDGLAIQHRDADGALDTSFGDAGTVNATCEGCWGYVKDVEMDADGSIVIAAAAHVPMGLGLRPATAITRILPDGTIDLQFESTRLLRRPQSLAIRSDGSMLIAGNIWRDSRDTYRLVIVALDRDARVERSFGEHGRLELRAGLGDAPGDIIALPSGKAVLAATRHYDGIPPTHASRCMLMRLTRTGHLDPSFGSAGRTSFRGPASSNCHVPAILRRPDGHLLLFVDDWYGPPWLWAFRSNGHVDPTDPPTYPDGPPWEGETFETHPSFLPDGSIVYGASTQDCADGCEPSRVFLVRLEPDGYVMEAFGMGGFTAPITGRVPGASSTAVLDDRRLLLALESPSAVIAYVG